jgi:hypothetical protein
MLQLEICFNDVRTNPLKYKSAYSCNYDSDIAPRVTADGRRLPLKWSDSATTDAADRCVSLISPVLMYFVAGTYELEEASAWRHCELKKTVSQSGSRTH